MTLVQYIRSADPYKGSPVVSLRGGLLRMSRGDTADLTAQEQTDAAAQGAVLISYTAPTVRSAALWNPTAQRLEDSSGTPLSVSGGGSGLALVAGGNLGATPSVDVTGKANVLYTGTLTANATLTITGLVAGSVIVLDVAQDGTGGRTLSVTVGGSTISLPVNTAASAGSLFEVVSPDGTNAHVAALGSGPASSSALGTVRLTGDLGGTASSPTVPGLATKADLVSGKVPVTQLGSGTPDGTKFLRDDQTYAVPAGGGGSAATAAALGTVKIVGTPADPANPTVPAVDTNGFVQSAQLPIRADHQKPAAALFEAYPRRFAQSSFTPGTGVLWVSAIALPKGVVVTSISVLPTTTGSGTHGWAALYDNSGTNAGPGAFLRQSTDDAAVAWTTNTIKTFTLSSTFTTTYAGMHYIGFMVVAGTMPTIASDGASVGTANQLPPLLSATGQGSLTTTATTPVSSIGAQSKQFYAYVS